KHLEQLIKSNVASVHGWTITAPSLTKENGEIRKNRKYTLAMVVSNHHGKTRQSNFIDVEIAPSSDRKTTIVDTVYDGNGSGKFTGILTSNNGPFKDADAIAAFPECATYETCLDLQDKLNEYLI